MACGIVPLNDPPNSVPFASSIASSVVLYFITDATGPNISSLKLDTLGVTSASIVASKKNHFLPILFHPVMSLAPEDIALAT